MRKLISNQIKHFKFTIDDKRLTWELKIFNVKLYACCRSWNKLFGVCKVVFNIFSNEHVLSNISITKLIFNPVPKLDLHMNFVLALTTVAVLFLTAFA